MGQPSANPKIRAVVMAASALDRRALHDVPPDTSGIEMVAVCASPSAARDKLRREEVDVLAIDAAMIDSQPLGALGEVAAQRQVPVVAFKGGGLADETLERVVKAISARELVEIYRSPKPTPPSRPTLVSTPVVAIGSSTGGPDALGELIPRLPEEFPATVLIAQHMPATFTPILARRLEQRSKLAIHEAQDGEPLLPGTVLIAPGDFHLEVAEGAQTVRLHQGPPENSCRPAADVLFRSVAAHLGSRSLALVLTGMGRDGWLGAQAIKESGGRIAVQDEETSVVWGMPGLIARDGLADHIATIPDLAEWLIDKLLDPRAHPLASHSEATRKP